MGNIFCSVWPHRQLHSGSSVLEGVGITLRGIGRDDVDFVTFLVEEEILHLQHAMLLIPQ